MLKDLKEYFFINHSPKEFHNLLVVFVALTLMLPFAFFFAEIHTYRTTKVDKDPLTFEAVFDLVKKDGYKHSINDFDSLLKVNSEAVRDAYLLTIKAYNLDDVNVKGYKVNSDMGKFKSRMGLPFEYEVTDWFGRILAFFTCLGIIGLTQVFLNFTLKPIVNKYKKFWVVAYLLSVVISSTANLILIIENF